MKSMLTYDMQNYAAATDDEPNIIVEMETKAPTTTTRTIAGSEKYSLRQRHKRKLSSDITSDNNNNNNAIYTNNEVHLTSSETQSKHQLVNCRKRQTKRNILAPTMQQKPTITSNAIIRTTKMPKAKTKAAPLSKYRRKTANARERTRMREINTAFEKLRYCVPPTISGEDTNQTNDKLTKITTLRFAMKYIELLSEALINPSVEASLLQELSLNGDNRFTTLAAPIAIPYQELSMTPEPTESRKNDKKTSKNSQKLKSLKTTSSKSKNSATKVVQNKRSINKKKKPQKKNVKKIQTSTPASLPLVLSPASTSSAYSSQYSNISFSSSASTTSDMSNSYIYDNCLTVPYVNINPMEVNNLLLESDGESLHLSEHCLSPLEGNNNNNNNNNQNNNNLFTTTTNSNCFASFDNMALSILENPLELSLRLLDSEVSDQQQPSACISPLSGLGSLTPFCDLLAADFSEHSSLDMFLT